MLLRAIFWFSLVVMLLPVGSDSIESKGQDISGGQTLVLFQSIANDLSGFCVRNPSSCKTAQGLAVHYGQRVKAHAENLGEYLASESVNADKMITGSVQSTH